LDGIDEVIENIVALSEITDHNILLDNLDKKGSINHYDDGYSESLYQAALAIGGQRISYYEHLRIWSEEKIDVTEKLLGYSKQCFQCELRKIAEQYTGKDLCEKSFSRKCYECYQFFFWDILLQITDGKEYTDMPDFYFEEMAFWSSEISAVKIEPIICEARPNEEGTFQNLLKKYIHHLVSFDSFIKGPIGNTAHPFNDFVLALVFFSLTEFLVHNDRRKIKKCDYCENFFIAKDIKRTTRCYSPKCEREYQKEKKRKQREKDPVKYGSISVP